MVPGIWEWFQTAAVGEGYERKTTMQKTKSSGNIEGTEDGGRNRDSRGETHRAETKDKEKWSSGQLEGGRYV